MSRQKINSPGLHGTAYPTKGTQDKKHVTDSWSKMFIPSPNLIR